MSTKPTTTIILTLPDTADESKTGTLLVQRGYLACACISSAASTAGKTSAGEMGSSTVRATSVRRAGNSQSHSSTW
jgi:hypothetical protein